MLGVAGGTRRGAAIRLPIVRMRGMCVGWPVDHSMHFLLLLAVGMCSNACIRVPVHGFDPYSSFYVGPWLMVMQSCALCWQLAL